MLRFLGSRFGVPLVQWYLSRTRNYSYAGLTLKILPGVFHPGFFFSTKFFLHHLEQLDLKGKALLELGAGSGLISFWAERKGAIVTASDFSSSVLNGLRMNKENLKSGITILLSDLFDQIPEQHFDFVIINPPYYPKNPANENQLAWFCGSEHQYFKKLFFQLASRKSMIGRSLVVLSEDCDTLTIRKIAESNNLQLQEMERRKFWREWNFIFEVK